MKLSVCCPHCSHTFSPVEPFPGYSNMSPIRREIIDCLIRDTSRFYTAQEIADYVYCTRWEPNDGPQTVRVHINHIRRQYIGLIVNDDDGKRYKLVLDSVNA